MIKREQRKNIKFGSGYKEHSLNLPFWRDNNKLWALPIKEEPIDIRELKWMVDVPFWEDEKGNIVVTVSEVLANPSKFPDHTKMIDDCDTNYPVHITKNKLNEWIILDGLHRLAKLIREGKEKLMVKKVTIEQLWLTKKD